MKTKTFKTPRSVIVRCRKFKILRPKEIDGGKLVGQAEVGGPIEIVRHFRNREERKIFWHEIFHKFEDEYDIAFPSHRDLDAIAGAMVDFEINNPEAYRK